MKIKNIILSIIALFAIFLSGCDSTQADTNKAPHKIDRQHVDNMSFDDNIQYHINNNGEYLDFTLINTGNNFIPIFYIDIDRDANSGYGDVNGAEYILEYNNIFKYIGNGQDWNWEYVSTLQTSDEYGHATITVKVPKNLLEGLSNSFYSRVFLLDGNWQFLGGSSNVSFTVEDNLPINDVIGDGDKIITVDNSETYIGFTHQFHNIHNPHVAYFIDSDNNTHTGDENGYDYIIEDDKIFNHNWSLIGQANFTRSGDTLTTYMWKYIVNLGNNIRVSAHIFDSNRNWKYYISGTVAIDGNGNGNNINRNKKIFIIGDSTVANPTPLGVGWGERVAQYMVNPENVHNLAQSGASSKSYRTQDWSDTKDFMRESNTEDGSYLLIHFGHNDETIEPHEQYMKTYPGIGNSFYNELRNYVIEARNIGVTPVLVTPVERMEKVAGWDLDYSHNTLDGDYAQTVRDLAQNEGVLLLDLQAKSWNKFNTYIDKAELISIFGYDPYDNSHFNSYGAGVVAGMVKELICESGDQSFCSQFR